ncbi:hypothetical protein Y032_0165g35 [Ancylostoma ceylanicum]|uniref:Uncharacterized protein n=1 Tax=Ancylostoma ceylanicum TaxID=53326 RepID=A0A016SX94_9BILA|nr:hypothetical protein Y032_0165g35 [Ancylostoma ceylanicum]
MHYHIVLLKKIDGMRDCTIAARPEREMHRNAKKPHSQSVYLFEKECTCYDVTQSTRSVAEDDITSWVQIRLFRQ